MVRIIVCDDEPHILEGLRHLLRKPDRDIVVASSGQEALQFIRQAPPALLITDIMMPQMSGLDLIAALRSETATRDLPVIILTAKGHAQDATMAQEVWGATVMAKPFQPTRLRELVDHVLSSGVCSSPSRLS